MSPEPTQTLPPSPSAPTDQAPAPEQTPRQRYADWPQKEDSRPQPWDLDAVGIAKADQILEPGQPNTVSPVVIRHSYPILAAGSAGSTVVELATRLQALGYVTDISQGENPYGVLSHDVMTAVEQFRQDYHVQEDPTAFGGNTEQSRGKAAAIVGPYTWEAIIRASERALEAAAA